VGDDIFIVEDLGNNRIRLIPAPTHVSEAGTPVNKALLQHMENHLVPPGAIIMWSGSINDIPVGWALCDGSNGTPDLRDRFIVGAGGSYNVGNTGGEMTVTLTTAHMPSHNHGATTNSAGGHQHNITIHGTTASANRLIFGYSSGTLNTTDQRSGELLALEGGGNYAIPTVNCDSAGAHSHTVTVNNAGSGIPHENRPPYYALAYIMKL
jgi:microcystin-dependent protein